MTTVAVLLPAKTALAEGGVTITVQGDQTIPPGGQTELLVNIANSLGGRTGAVAATLGTVHPEILTSTGMHYVTFYAGKKTGKAVITVEVAARDEIVIGQIAPDGVRPHDSCEVHIVGEGGDDQSDDGSDTRRIGPDDDLV